MGAACLRSEMMVLELRHAGCYSKALVAVNLALALIDGVIAVLAFYQLMRIHSRTPHRGWTRQKDFKSDFNRVHEVVPSTCTNWDANAASS